MPPLCGKPFDLARGIASMSLASRHCSQGMVATVRKFETSKPEPQYVVLLRHVIVKILLGMVLMSCCVVIHASGVTWALRRLR